MRIVAVADTHLYDLAIPDGDLFVHAGDLCRRGTLKELEVAAGRIRGLPHPHKIVVAGNHDWPFVHHPAEARRLLGDGVVYLEGEGATVAGLRVWGGPWQPEFNEWAFNLPRGAALAEKWAAIPLHLDLLITHGPPYGIGDQSSELRHGDHALRERLHHVKPKLHLFGHIHEDRGAWLIDGTTFVNCTTCESSLPATVIDVGDQGVAVLDATLPPVI